MLCSFCENTGSFYMAILHNGKIEEVCFCEHHADHYVCEKKEKKKKKSLKKNDEVQPPIEEKKDEESLRSFIQQQEIETFQKEMENILYQENFKKVNPPTKEELQKEMNQCIKEENYKKAAEIRDQLKGL